MLESRVAIITGAAQGIGRACTEAFLRAGAAFTWPSAVVRVMDVFQVTTTNANGEIGSFEAWVGLDSGLINRPIVDR